MGTGVEMIPSVGGRTLSSAAIFAFSAAISAAADWSGSGSFVGVGVGVVLFFDGMMNGLRANGLTGYELIVELSEVTES